MALLQWKSGFATGIDGVDYEHAHLVDLINGRLYRLRGNPPKSLVKDILSDVKTEIATHFAIEERIMRERGYDRYAEHKIDHDQLMDGIRDIIGAIDRNGETKSVNALVERLSHWFVDHFRDHDIRLHQMLG